MSILIVNTGTSANKGDGDSLRTAFNKINANFSYLETLVGTGGGQGGGGGTGTNIANTGDIIFTNNIISTKNANEDIIFNPNGVGRVRFVNTPIQFDNGTSGKSAVQILNTKLSGSPAGLGTDNVNSSLRIIGDKDNLGTLVDLGLYDGSLSSWRSKVLINWEGNIFSQGSITAKTTLNSQGSIHANGNIQADGDVIGSYVIANYGFKFADGTTQLTAVTTTTATATRLGAIKVGNNLSVTADGTLSAIITGTVATTSNLGVVQIGAGLNITQDGLLSVQGAQGGGDVITTSTIATTSTLGVIKVGAGLSITADGRLSTTGLGLGHLLVDDTTIYPDDPNKAINFSNADINLGTAGTSYISIPATTNSIDDMRILSHGVMLITTEPDLANGIVIAPGVDGYGPGYVAVGASGIENTSGLFLFANSSQIDLWPNQTIASLNTSDPNSGVMDLWTTDLGYISLRPDSTATVIVTGGGIDIRSGGLRFPDNTYMTTGAATGVTSFNHVAGAITFTATDIATQLGYVPYDGTTNPNGFLTSAVITFNGASGAITFTASNIISQLGYTPYSTANPAGYISSNAVVKSFNGSTGTVTFTATDIATQLGYVPYDGSANLNHYLTTASLTSIDGDIIPSSDSKYNLGSLAHQWKSLYVSTNTIYVGGFALSVNNLGHLLVGGLDVSTSGYDQSLNTTDNVQFNTVKTNAVTFSDGSTQTTAVFQVPLATTTQTGIVYALTSATSTAPVALGYNALRNDAGSGTNTAIGYNAMCANTLGNSNTAVGARTLARNTTGNSNVAVGVGALCFNTTGEVNVAVGVGTLSANTYGSWNSALGYNALFWNKTGYGNVAVGAQALYCNRGDYNVAIGCVSLQKNSLGYGNVGVGSASLNNNTLGSQNVAIGNEALLYNTTGNSNVAVGPATLLNNTYGQYNVAMGYQAMCFNRTGNDNIAIGTTALYSNIAGSCNIAIGQCTLKCSISSCYDIAIGIQSMACATGGYSNVALGYGALCCNIQGRNNFAVGYGSLSSNTTGSDNIAIGWYTLANNISGNDNIALGGLALGNNIIGKDNFALGHLALGLNTSGSGNIAVGRRALISNTSGNSNIALGCCSMECNTVGSNNIAFGFGSLHCNIGGCQNIAIGLTALYKNTSGFNNTALGYNSLCSNTFGDSNVALGWGNMTLNTTGSCNTVIGQASLPANTFGSSNIAIGRCALIANTTGCHNMGFGCGSLAGSILGNNNIAIGQNSGCSITAGSNNVIIGSNTGTIFAGGDNNVLLSDGSGNIKILFTTTGALSFGNIANFGTTGYVLQSNGPTSPPSWINAGTLTSGVATTATNIQNGTAGQIPYQSASSLTSFFGPGTAGQILVSAGTSAPTYTNTSTIQVGSAGNVLGGSAGQLVYQSASGATSFLALGTAGQVLTAGATTPTYVNTATLQVGYAINIIGGTTGQLLYQSAGNATGFVAAGTARQLLQSNGAASPTYVNTATLQVGYATNILGGTAGQINYQSASGVTAFVATAATGTILVSGGTTAAPVFQNTLTLAGSTVATSTQSGALVVSGGAGIGGKLWVGGNIDTQQIALNSIASSTTTNIANALYVAGGAWIGGTSYIRGSAIFDGTVVFNSSTVYTVNQSVSTSSNFLQLHSPTTATWSFNDGKDIGLVFNYYGSGDANAFLGRAIDTGYLEWYETGTDGTSQFTGTYGTFKTGNIQLVSNVANLGNTNTGALVVTGGVGISGGLYVGGTITGSLTGTASSANNLTGGAVGSLPYQSNGGTTSFLSLGTNGFVLTAGASGPQWTSAGLVTSGQATTATNLAGGTAGQIPYQLTTGSTAFFGPGSAGQILVSTGANTPAFTNTGTIQVGSASNILGGSIGGVPYQSGSGVTAFLALGSTGRVLTAGASGPQWTDLGTITSGASTTATNLSGGTAGQLAYQSAPGTTNFAGPGTAGQILVSAGTNAPTYTNTSTIQVGYATNLLGGSAGAIHYQNGSGSTGFVTGNSGQLLVSGGTGVPVYTNTASIQVGAATNILGGAKGGIPYQSNTSTTALLPIGSQGQVLTVNNTSDAPQWTNIGSLASGNATTATNLAGGTVGQIPYQSAVGITSYFGPGTSGRIMLSQGAGTPFFVNTSSVTVGFANTAINLVGSQSGALLYQTGTNQTGTIPLGTSTSVLVAGTTAPQWVSASTIVVNNATTATNIAGGVSGQLIYQSAPGVTQFVGTGTSGQVLVSAGSSVPNYTSSLSALTLQNTIINGYISYDQIATSVGTSTVTVDSFAVAAYRSAKYVISISNTGTGEYQTTEALVVHNGSNAFIKSDSVFSGLYSLMSFTVLISTGNVLLQGTGVAAGNQVKVQKVYITV